MIDTHAHLCDPAFENDLDQVLERARVAGVRAIVCVAEDLEDSKRNLELCARAAGGCPALLPAAGVFPSRAGEETTAEAAAFIRENRARIRAIGEVGLDYWIAQDEAQRAAQVRALRLFTSLSLELDLPINVHSRSAGRQAVDTLLQAGARRVHMHAFGGRASAALPGVEEGYLFSVPASVVRSRQKQKLVAALPLSSLMVETDSPVLGPLADERNEPANLDIAVRAIAELKNLPYDEVRETVTLNAVALYSVEGISGRRGS